MGIRFKDMSDAEIGAMVRDRFERLSAAHADGFTDTHPRDQWNADSATLRDYREAAASGGAPGQAGDDVQPEESERGQAGAVPAQDGCYVVTDGVPTFEYANGRTVHGNDAILARSRAIAPNRAKIRSMSAAIKNYGRLK